MKLYKLTTCVYTFKIYIVKAGSETKARRYLYNYLCKMIHADHQYVFNKKQTTCNQVIFNEKVVQVS